MTKTLFIILLVWLIISSCSNDSPAIVKHELVSGSDTVVLKRTITNELAGSAYRKRATEYSLLISHDTSQLKCYFEESNDGKVGLDFAFADNKSYQKQFPELQFILGTASIEYNLDSLSVALFHLTETGDLAIEVTKQLSEQDIKNVTDNHRTSAFLLKSKLTSELNALLSPYRKQIKRYAIEHPMLVDHSQITEYNSVETAPSEIPSKVLSGTIWAYFK